jgi:plasmid replication initiation protein
LPFNSLQSVLPAIGLTKRKIKKLDAICLVRDERRNCKQELSYHARPFVLCGIPLRRPPIAQLTHTRRNGHFALDIVGHPRFGLPFGQDRLIPVWVATLAVLQKSRLVRFACPSQMLDYFELPKNGYHYERIVQGFQRIFGATIFFGTEEQRQKAVVLDSTRFHFLEKCAAAHLSNYVTYTIMWCKSAKSFRPNPPPVISAT